MKITKRKHKENAAAVPSRWLNVDFFLKVNFYGFSVGYSYDPDAINVLWIVLRVVR